MQRWYGRVAIVTGASSGIGYTLAKELTRHSIKVAALARRLDKLQKLAEECEQLDGKLKVYKCDVTIDSDIEQTIKRIVDDLGPVSILINNAGVSIPVVLTDTSTGSCRKIYETHNIGLVTLTQQVVEVMKKNNLQDGHIINMNSLIGHCVYPVTGNANYCASKNALRILTECLRNELSELDFNTRVTSISPGLVNTPLTAKYSNHLPKLSADNIVECVIFVLQLNPSINVSEMTIEPVKETLSQLAHQ